MNKFASTTLSLLVSGLAAASFAADAATIRVQCEQRSVDRARISVDGNDLARLPAGALYRAQVVSGGNVATSAGAALFGDEVEFDFDSKPADIAAGATAIASTFAINGTVTGKILMPDGSTLISDTIACRVRSR